MGEYGKHFKTYEEVLTNTKGRNRHLLLGNGFSINYNNQIFNYNKLAEYINETKDEDLIKIFKAVNKSNFEEIMEQIDITIKIISTFGNNQLITQLTKAKIKLKNTLIDAIDSMHPSNVFNVSETEANYCKDFLGPFLEKRNSIITTNYDLLLYWVLMKKNGDFEKFSDGFLRNSDDNELTWGSNRFTQNIFYLHGALHLFDKGNTIVKEEYDNTNKNWIKDRIDKRINENEYPIFVTAGSGNEKLKHIMHNGYLSNCYNHLKNIDGSLITYGFSFNNVDNHIIDAINNAAKNFTEQPKKIIDNSIQDTKLGKLFSIYIGVFTEEERQKMEYMAKNEIFKCKVYTYDINSVNLWRE